MDGLKTLAASTRSIAWCQVPSVPGPAISPQVLGRRGSWLRRRVNLKHLGGALVGRAERCCIVQCSGWWRDTVIDGAHGYFYLSFGHVI